MYPRMDMDSRYGERSMDAKVVVMGSTSTGKTSLLHRYTQGRFDPKATTATTGASFVTKKVYVDGLKVRLQLWDTAGQERFRSMVCIHSFRLRLKPNRRLNRHPCIIEAQMPRSFCTISRTHPLSRTYEAGCRVRVFPVKYFHSAS